MNTECQLYDLWPKEVGYDTFSGYKSDSYELDNDPIKKVEILVESWKKTSLEHQFKSPAISTLSCKPVEQGHELVFVAHALPQSIHCKIEKIKAEVDVDEDQADTCVKLTINGKNLDNGKSFSLFLLVFRYPEIKTTLKYNEAN